MPPNRSSGRYNWAGPMPQAMSAYISLSRYSLSQGQQDGQEQPDGNQYGQVLNAGEKQDHEQGVLRHVVRRRLAEHLGELIGEQDNQQNRRHSHPGLGGFPEDIAIRYGCHRGHPRSGAVALVLACSGTLPPVCVGERASMARSHHPARPAHASIRECMADAANDMRLERIMRFHVTDRCRFTAARRMHRTAGLFGRRPAGGNPRCRPRGARTDKDNPAQRRFPRRSRGDPAPAEGRRPHLPSRAARGTRATRQVRSQGVPQGHAQRLRRACQVGRDGCRLVSGHGTGPRHGRLPAHAYRHGRVA